ncbi:MAG: DUF362 domain-containing protein [Clostridia bacterium]|nr:DUF362 domain-containing protein [Clostridia bacterium]
MSHCNFDPQSPVTLAPCANYADTTVKAALEAVLSPIGGLDWVVPGMTVGIKANLVSAMKPEKCATTHPSLLCALTAMLRSRGARVIIGDSPGGVYTSAFVGQVYRAAGLSACEAVGAELNRDLGTVDTAFPEARVLKSFTYTSWLDSCDAIIDFCKLKSHGMMGMSAAAKNLFGVIPGTMKPEYHFRFPNMTDFAHMLVDINDYFADKVKLCLVDAVEGMEGNGPTQGSPRHIGLLLASRSPHAVDAICCQLIGLSEDAVPTLSAARKRGLLPDEVELITVGIDGEKKTAEDFALKDFRHVAVRHGHLFASKGKLVSKILGKLLSSRPQLTKSECVGCRKCAEICPAKAITMKDKKAVIDREACIRCFCCQEFCPTGAMKVHRTWIARVFMRSKK